MRLLVGVLVAGILAPACGRGQAADVSTPFVSRLKAQVQGSAVILTWQDSPDALGPVTVFRHSQEITPETLGQARNVADVPHGTGSYSDHPPDQEPYFYAALASDDQGRRFDVLVAFRNKTLTPCAVERIGAAEETGARVTSLHAEAVSGAIRVSFQTDRPQRPLVLYRSTAAITETADLAGAVALDIDPAATTYEDAPPAGVGFYYAVVDAELVRAGKAVFVAGENATTAAASIPLPPAHAPGLQPAAVAAQPSAAAAQPAAGSTASLQAPGLQAPAADAAATTTRSPSRTRPLPYLALERGVYSGQDLAPSQLMPVRRQLSREAEEAVAGLVAGFPAPARQPMQPLVLEIDRAAAAGAEQALLQSIAREVSAGTDGSGAEARLRSFLSVRRDAGLEARARFYLGQALYGQGRMAEALVEMLPAFDLYHAETRPWVERCLDELAGMR